MSRFGDMLGGAAVGGGLGYLTGEVLGIDSGRTALAGAGIGALSQADLFRNPASGAATGALMGGLAGSALSPVLGEAALPVGVIGGGLLGYNQGVNNQMERYGYNSGMASYGLPFAGGVPYSGNSLVYPGAGMPVYSGGGMPWSGGTPYLGGGSPFMPGGGMPGMHPMTLMLAAMTLMMMAQQQMGQSGCGCTCGSRAFLG
ncbi:MAG: hypothetical protein AB1758_00265 [Candidatus Eremiobacterota bacterium]